MTQCSIVRKTNTKAFYTT